MTTRKILLLDGGFSTALQQVGFECDKYKLWSAEANVSAPEKVIQAFKSFIESGVDILTTNTYHSAQNLNTTSSGDYYDKGVTLLQDVLQEYPEKNITILGSIGPYAITLRDASEYTGTYVDSNEHRDLIFDHYYNNVARLMTHQVKYLLFETIPSAFEAQTLVLNYKSLPTNNNVDFIISFACKNGESLCHGERFSEVIDSIIRNPKVIGVGINCTQYSYISPLLRSIKCIPDGKQILVYPNSGFADGPKLDDLSDEELKNLLNDWADHGATIIGGCCGVSPALIGRMRKAIDLING